LNLLIERMSRSRRCWFRQIWLLLRGATVAGEVSVLSEKAACGMKK